MWISLRVLPIDTAISFFVKLILEKLHNQLCKKNWIYMQNTKNFEFLSYRTCNQTLKVFANILVISQHRNPNLIFIILYNKFCKNFLEIHAKGLLSHRMSRHHDNGSDQGLSPWYPISLFKLSPYSRLKGVDSTEMEWRRTSWEPTSSRDTVSDQVLD